MIPSFLDQVGNVECPGFPSSSPAAEETSFSVAKRHTNITDLINDSYIVRDAHFLPDICLK